MPNVRGTVVLDSRTLLYLLQWCRTSYSTVVLARNPALVVPHMPSTSPSTLSSQQRDNYELFAALVRVANSHFNYRIVLSRPQLDQPQGALVNEVDHGTITKDWGVGQRSSFDSQRYPTTISTDSDQASDSGSITE